MLRSGLPITFVVLAALHQRAVAQPIGSITFRDVYVVPFDYRFQGTQVGGLSGIDYDAKAETYYIICDDRSALQPARYYRASIRISEKGIDTVLFTDKVDLHGQNGKPYPKNSIDPEGLRLNPMTGEAVWTSEGERVVKEKDTVLNDPGIFVIRDGKFVGQFPTPPNARMSPHNQGSRNNGAFEALTFADEYRTLWVALEEPLYQDGPRADVEQNISPVRFYKFDFKSRELIAQYAIDLEPVAHKPVLPTAFRVNGVTDILDSGGGNLLIVERSFTTGRLPCTVRLFLVDFTKADDVRDVPSLKEKGGWLAVKTLLIDLDTLGIYVDNVEGITWGPLLPNGNRTLLLITDNNFQSFQKTQVFLFEVAKGK